jgi:hypothetical protein
VPGWEWAPSRLMRSLADSASQNGIVDPEAMIVPGGKTRRRRKTPRATARRKKIPAVMRNRSGAKAAAQAAAVLALAPAAQAAVSALASARVRKMGHLRGAAPATGRVRRMDRKVAAVALAALIGRRATRAWPKASGTLRVKRRAEPAPIKGLVPARDSAAVPNSARAKLRNKALQVLAKVPAKGMVDPRPKAKVRRRDHPMDRVPAKGSAAAKPTARAKARKKARASPKEAAGVVVLMAEAGLLSARVSAVPLLLGMAEGDMPSVIGAYMDLPSDIIAVDAALPSAIMGADMVLLSAIIAVDAVPPSGIGDTPSAMVRQDTLARRGDLPITEATRSVMPAIVRRHIPTGRADVPRVVITTVEPAISRHGMGKAGAMPAKSATITPAMVHGADAVNNTTQRMACPSRLLG